jgi:YHS domain-containing protein
MTVETAKAKSAVHDGHVYYFCSADCRDNFEASPGAYVKAASAPPQPREHRHESHH